MSDERTIKNCLYAGYNKLFSNRRYIDSIDVFPAKDGDAGSNMVRTYKAGLDAIKFLSSSDIGQILHTFSKGMLRNARGNSGVILAALFKGFSDFVCDKGYFGSDILYGALDNALRQTEEYLRVPIQDGTVLSVVAAARETAKSLTDTSVSNAFRKIETAAKEAAEKTKDAMPELKSENTSDSGALGLYMILSAIDEALNGKRESYSFSKDITFRKLPPFNNIEYIYSADFIVLCDEPFSKKTFEKQLLGIGSSVAVVSDGSELKVHLHTNYPNLAIGHGLRLGELYNIKIENMAKADRVERL